MALIEKTPNKATQRELITTLRTVTDGKMFVELERAQLTMMLAVIAEQEGKLNEAAQLLQEVQVETIGAMELKEKAEYSLEQYHQSSGPPGRRQSKHAAH